jgi:hypothetical protein
VERSRWSGEAGRVSECCGAFLHAVVLQRRQQSAPHFSSRDSPHGCRARTDVSCGGGTHTEDILR